MKRESGFSKSSVTLATAAVLGMLGASMPAYSAPEAIEGVAFTTKFVCGARGGTFLDSSVNVHNPSLEEICVNKKVVIANPQREPRGPISEKVLERLGPNEAVGVDCTDIRRAFADPPDGFIEGFVVLELVPDPLLEGHPPALAVQGVYTATRGAATGISVMNNFVGEGGGLDVEFPLDTPPTFPCPPLQ